MVNAQCTAPVIVTHRTDKKSVHTLVTCAVHKMFTTNLLMIFKERYFDFQTVNVMIKVTIRSMKHMFYALQHSICIVLILIGRRWHFPNMVHTKYTQINLNAIEWNNEPYKQKKRPYKSAFKQFRWVFHSTQFICYLMAVNLYSKPSQGLSNNRLFSWIVNHLLSKNFINYEFLVCFCNKSS